MAKNCPVKEEEWIEILSAMLRHEHVDGMEAVASVDSESVLVITFRKRVRGITVSHPFSTAQSHLGLVSKLVSNAWEPSN